jgi:hypothetical protein
MTLTGKGFMIWKIPSCESGNPSAIAAAAQQAGLTHVLIKIADGTYAYNINRTTQVDLVPPVVQALRARGIQVWGWHYIYGSNPVGEAQTAVQRVKSLGLSGYIIDAEVEFQSPGMDVAARRFMTELRNGLPTTQVALSSFRFPSLHGSFPFKDFLDKCNWNMPQVYWQAAHNPDAQLLRCVREFQAMTPYRPIMPTGPVYAAGDWKPTPEEIITFLDSARQQNLQSANFFTWDYRKSMPELWNAIAAYSWGASTLPPDVPQQYIAAMNTHNIDKVLSLYTPDAIRVTAAQTIQGTSAIRTWLTKFLTSSLPNAVFSLDGVSGSGSSRSFNWSGLNASNKITDGNDTIGIRDGKIAYHYCYYKYSSR